MPRARATNETRFLAQGSENICYATSNGSLTAIVLLSESRMRRVPRLREIVELDDEGVVEDNNFIVIIYLNDLWKLESLFLPRWKLGNDVAFALHLRWKVEEYPRTLLHALYLDALNEDAS
ncbi:hypothetical protein Tco_0147912, partial [Tanacetum coccineum]